jgi:hypothetical protein
VCVNSCGISGADYPFNSVNGSSTTNLLTISVFPSNVTASKAASVILTDRCEGNSFVLGTWASYAQPEALRVDFSLKTQNGTVYKFDYTGNTNCLHPGNMNPNMTPTIWLAPCGSQPSSPLTASLQQTVDYCAQEICWTVTINTTTDCIGQDAVGSIVAVGTDCTSCLSTYSTDSHTNQPLNVCGEMLAVYNMCCADSQALNGVNICINRLVKYDSNNQLVLVPGSANQSVIPAIITGCGSVSSANCCDSSSQCCTSDCATTLISNASNLVPCSAFYAWFRIYRNPNAVVGGARSEVGPDDSTACLNCDSGLVAPELITLDPATQMHTFGYAYMWQVQKGKNGSVFENTLRFVLVRCNSDGDYLRTSIRQLYCDLYKASGFGTGDSEVFQALDTDNSKPLVCSQDGKAVCSTASGFGVCSNLKDPTVVVPISTYAKATAFIAIGDYSTPYQSFSSETGTNLQQTLPNFTAAGIVTNGCGSLSKWFGLVFGGRNNTCLPKTPQGPSCSDAQPSI